MDCVFSCSFHFRISIPCASGSKVKYLNLFDLIRIDPQMANEKNDPFLLSAVDVADQIQGEIRNEHKLISERLVWFTAVEGVLVGQV